MTYSKPELLATEAALDAIRGNKQEIPAVDDGSTFYTLVPAYEVDE